MTEYTPTTEEVRKYFIHGLYDKTFVTHSVTLPPRQGSEEVFSQFNRWLEQIKQEVREEVAKEIEAFARTQDFIMAKAAYTCVSIARGNK